MARALLFDRTFLEFLIFGLGFDQPGLEIGYFLDLTQSGKYVVFGPELRGQIRDLLLIAHLVFDDLLVQVSAFFDLVAEVDLGLGIGGTFWSWTWV